MGVMAWMAWQKSQNSKLLGSIPGQGKKSEKYFPLFLAVSFELIKSACNHWKSLFFGIFQLVEVPESSDKSSSNIGLVFDRHWKPGKNQQMNI